MIKKGESSKIHHLLTQKFQPYERPLEQHKSSEASLTRETVNKDVKLSLFYINVPISLA